MRAVIQKKYNMILLISSVVFLLVNNDVLVDLFNKWYAQELTGFYSHGLLVAVIVIYIIYTTITKNRHMFVPNFSLLGAIIFIASQFLFLISKLAGVNFLEHILLVTSLLGFIWSVYSFHVTKLFLLPAILFSLSFPIWGDLAPHLQKVAIFVTNILLSLTGLPYFREQALFHFPNGVFEVARECAGLQQLLVAWIIGLLFSMQYKLHIKDILKTIVYISIASIIINAIRIIIIMYIGYYTKMESSLIHEHIFLGWIIFGIGIQTFLFLYSKRNFIQKPENPNDDGQSANIGSSKNAVTIYISILILLLMLPDLSELFILKMLNSKALHAQTHIDVSGAWEKQSDTLSLDWSPNYPRGDNVITGVYRNQNDEVNLSIISYARIDGKTEPINMSNKSYNPQVWTLIHNEEIPVSIGSEHGHGVTFDYLTSKNNKKIGIISYYVINGKKVDNLIKAKIEMIFGFFKLQYDIKIVCIAMDSDLQMDTIKTILLDFSENLKFQ